MDLSRPLCILQHRKSFEKHGALTVSISYLSYRSTVRIFDRCGSGDAYGSVEFGCRSEHYSGKSGLLEMTSGQPDGLAAKGSGRAENHYVNPLGSHVLRHGLDGLRYELRALPLKSVE